MHITKHTDSSSSSSSSSSISSFIYMYTFSGVTILSQYINKPLNTRV